MDWGPRHGPQTPIARNRAGEAVAVLDFRYLSVAVWSCSHWSARGIQVTRSRVA